MENWMGSLTFSGMRVFGFLILHGRRTAFISFSSFLYTICMAFRLGSQCICSRQKTSNGISIILSPSSSILFPLTYSQDKHMQETQTF